MLFTVNAIVASSFSKVILDLPVCGPGTLPPVPSVEIFISGGSFDLGCLEVFGGSPEGCPDIVVNLFRASVLCCLRSVEGVRPKASSLLI